MRHFWESDNPRYVIAKKKKAVSRFGRDHSFYRLLHKVKRLPDIPKYYAPPPTLRKGKVVQGKRFLAAFNPA